MSLFNYLVHIREDAPFYSHAWSRKEVLANFLLNTLYKARYELHQKCDVLTWKLAEAKRENKMLSRKLDVILRIHAGCIEPLRPTPESSIEINQFADMDDASFLSIQKGS